MGIETCAGGMKRLPDYLSIFKLLWQWRQLWRRQARYFLNHECTAGIFQRRFYVCQATVWVATEKPLWEHLALRKWLNWDWKGGLLSLPPPTENFTDPTFWSTPFFLHGKLLREDMQFIGQISSRFLHGFICKCLALGGITRNTCVGIKTEWGCSLPSSREFVFSLHSFLPATMRAPTQLLLVCITVQHT